MPDFERMTDDLLLYETLKYANLQGAYEGQGMIDVGEYYRVRKVAGRAEIERRLRERRLGNGS